MENPLVMPDDSQKKVDPRLIIPKIDRAPADLTALPWALLDSEFD